ncbi:hypothetical protein E2C01_003456 [Portunus trituberculatus]|uniref:Uncharacterized protein n=1 Tax=Portunus trituberculatus TaxID=210409 RepID=A0A5B7CTL4_PORTR|nr:hypothetical protein [Portunus trituberculatus]
MKTSRHPDVIMIVHGGRSGSAGYGLCEFLLLEKTENLPFIHSPYFHKPRGQVMKGNTCDFSDKTARRYPTERARSSLFPIFG